MVKIKVPATTANLGPGFDSLGCALSLYAEIEFEARETGLLIDGCDPAYQNEENLMVVAYDKTMERLGLKRKGLYIKFHSDIPICRGLGSSAALIVAGCMAANVMHGNRLKQAELLNLCNAIEGHPDNVAPALYGGLIASLVEENQAYSVAYPISEEACFCVLIPDFQTSTHEARKILPKQVAFEDAIFNLSRTAVLCHALGEWNEELLGIALKDRLHQPYRSQLIYEYDKVREICLKQGAAAFFISGSGPTCIALSKYKDFSQRVQNDLKQCQHQWQVLDVKADADGASVMEVE